MKLFLIANGENTGALTVDIDGNTHRVQYAVDDNGRGARVSETITLEDRLPQRWEIIGTSLMGGAVDERFFVTDGVATWDSQADVGTDALAGRFYLPADGSPYHLALLIDHVSKGSVSRLNGEGKSIDLLPSGTARIETVTTDLPALAGMSVLRVTGVSLAEQYLLCREDEVVGISDGSLHVAEDLVSHAQEIALALGELSRARLGEISRNAIVADGGTTVVRGVSIVDARNGRVSEPTDIVVRDGLVARIGSAHGVTADTIIDGSGRFAMAGLHDMHAHLTPSSALMYMAAGVTSVRDMGNDNALLPALVGDIREARMIGPSVVPAGFLEGRSPFSARFGKIVDSLDEALAAVDWYADHGFTMIKIYNSFTPQWVQPTASHAHSRGMRVLGHVPAFMNADRAVEAGYDEITHLNQLALGWVLDPEEDTRTPLRLTALTRLAGFDPMDAKVTNTLNAMREHGVGLDTTLVILEMLMLSRARTVLPAHEPIIDHMPAGYRRSRKRTYVPFRDQTELQAYDEAFAALLAITKRLHDEGVALWPGTDDGTGMTVHRELELYVEAGLGTAEVLRIATIDCAQHLGRNGSRGAVEEGQVADFVLLDANPLEDISAIRQVALTIAEGRLINPAAIYEGLGIVPFTALPQIVR